MLSKFLCITIFRYLDHSTSLVLGVNNPQGAKASNMWLNYYITPTSYTPIRKMSSMTRKIKSENIHQQENNNQPKQ